MESDNCKCEHNAWGQSLTKPNLLSRRSLYPMAALWAQCTRATKASYSYAIDMFVDWKFIDVAQATV